MPMPLLPPQFALRRGVTRVARRRTVSRAASAALSAALSVALAVAGSFYATADASSEAPKPARLVLQITVDQLRGDLALRCRDRWSKKGGFRRLYGEGAVFSDAHHRHANTETIVGHATLATGTDPSVHGMVGNVWLDRSTGQMRYNIEDQKYEIVGSARGVRSGDDDDDDDDYDDDDDDHHHDGVTGHAETPKPSVGRSPEAMLAPAIADSIARAGRGQAKVFAVSLKDRGAVPMGGHAGKAFWMSNSNGEFVSSTYYYPGRTLPSWAKKWNAARHADRYNGKSWTLLLEPKTYRFAQRDDMPWEAPPAGMSRGFPHRYDRRRLGEGFYSALQASPFGDDLLVDFTRSLLRAEKIGKDGVLDYVSVGLSSNDYIGHRYGPDSLEMEDEVLRLDHVIAKLLDAADEAAGRGRTLFVLSSDHGIAEPPAELAGKGIDSGQVVLSRVEASAAMQKLAKKAGANPIRRWPPYMYLDNRVLAGKGIDAGKATQELKTEIEKLPGVFAAYTRGEILGVKGARLPENAVARAVARSFHPDRSGDIHVVSKPGWQIAYELPTSSQFATGHGTPWDYDTFVPLIFAGPRVPHVVVGRRVATVDVAPTIAALVGVPAPAAATGRVLSEAVR